VPQQHAPSRFLKVAVSAGLHHAPPVFTRFMAAHPKVSRFLAEHPKVSRFLVEHPKTSRFVFSLAHLMPVLDRYIPFAPHFVPAYNPRDQRSRGPAFRR